MKAIVCHGYGAPDALRLEDVDKPTPGDSEVLIQVRAVSLNAYDWGLIRGTPRITRMVLGVRRPKFNRVGRDVAGRVESVGRSVTQSCGETGLGYAARSPAEYACASESYLAAEARERLVRGRGIHSLAGLTALQTSAMPGASSPDSAS
jgi:NADPH:quinone reductase-like Zn-dependent oxidoreductase